MLLFLKTNLFFFGNDHHQEGKTNEDSPEFFENLIISENVYTSHNYVPCTSAPKENALKKLDEPTPSMIKDQSEFEATNQNKD
jgi:sensor domain CHASE-containing protein